MKKIEILPLSKDIDNLCIDCIAGDKSISHRSAIFSFFSNKQSRVRNYLFGEDTLDTLKIAMQLGLEVKDSNGNINNIESIKNSKELYFNPRNGINEPLDILYCGMQVQQ